MQQYQDANKNMLIEIVEEIMQCLTFSELFNSRLRFQFPLLGNSVYRIIRQQFN